MRKKKQPVTTETNTDAVKKKRDKTIAPAVKPADEGWDRLMKIGEELGKGWQSDKSAVEILSEMRR